MILNKFTNREEMENRLLEQIIQALDREVKSSGNACLLLSGGSTPVNLYKNLSHAELPWDEITVALVDERFVSTNDSNSNEKMIREALCQNHAQNARLIGMVYDEENESLNLEKARKAYEQFVPPPTVCLLGMGTDGHMASLFPGDAASEADLQSGDGNTLISTQAPVHPRKRISLSKKQILSAKHLLLMITGEEKLNLLKQDSRPTLPIDHFVEQAAVCWSI